MKSCLLALCFVLALPSPGRAADKISIVAAENFYGDIAGQIGGDHVAVTSILSNPDQDPHLFEASASVARGLSAARIVIYNGIDYDPWMAKLLSAAKNQERQTIVVADLAGHKPGDNPHVWYDIKTMRIFAQTLADTLSRDDAMHQADYRQNLQTVEASLQAIEARIAPLHDRLKGKPVTATEPVFGCMLAALGMVVRNQSFQLAVMNNTEPSASDVAAFESDLKMHKVALLIYNSQASDPIAVRMKKLAEDSRIPVVGITETVPVDYDDHGLKENKPYRQNYQNWILDELDAIDHALPQ